VQILHTPKDATVPFNGEVVGFEIDLAESIALHQYGGEHNPFGIQVGGKALVQWVASLATRPHFGPAARAIGLPPSLNTSSHRASVSAKLALKALIYRLNENRKAHAAYAERASLLLKSEFRL
jgi:hypothetical protein